MARKVIDNPNHCSLVHAMNIIGGKWKPIIIYILANGNLRFGKLLIFIPTISKKVLTEQLRELEEDGIINRERFAETPPRVEYSLTEVGEALLPILRQLSEWTAASFEDVEFEACKIVDV
ncbi:helix-turn-helix domain-containing protein [Kordia sp.]|uniref:winged helix-turn-helix transcriptional regulator n=1 Tax=Kordia sp. TaxID=1965332 RepID=UPI0025B9B3DB|nr:helix-turn-helix domain-containing protein [Kordia sp.]MCH2193612.1 helix-turn-helix transcriptional regulator [Kordia sp.]